MYKQYIKIKIPITTIVEATIAIMITILLPTSSSSSSSYYGIVLGVMNKLSVADKTGDPTLASIVDEYDPSLMLS